MAEPESRWLILWQGGDGDWHPLLGEDDLEDTLFDECGQLVDLCEQEILEGGHWDEVPNGDNLRTIERDRLWDEDILPQLQQALDEGEGEINFNPEYAVAQRENYKVWIKKEVTE